MVDRIHFENYQVVGRNAGYGFSVYSEKRLSPRLTAGAGYAQHDRPGLYSDRFAPGKRVFLNVHLAVNQAFSVSAAVAQAIVNDFESGPRTRVDVALNYNLLAHIRRTGLF